ncbi:peptidase S8 and S53, subtilisin, kexin, sedolisin [Marinobacter algicola DG893]|uniref:Peptidase S8 and S53, subtilisin, kexin, sedolisin n=2 Tax=Marinobacter algicola TaxID=236100 RepID=A6EYC8_9GAMM|nr:peptidase S8 and S53, subtilisin, kexin, sedolisin [Marinobacter algicola DG893]
MTHIFNRTGTMKPFLLRHLFPAIALCTLSAPALSIGVGDVTSGQIDPITRQVEQKTQRMVEQAMDRRLEKQINTQATELMEPLEVLPSVLSILTRQGQKAFNDIQLDDGFRAVEGQWLVTGTGAELARLDQPGITVLERRELTGLGMTVVRFRVTAELDSHNALQDALPELADRLDRNHIYAPQMDAKEPLSETNVPQWRSLCTAPVRVGMVDTSIATDHRVFESAQVVQERFLALAEVDGTLTEPAIHGTAVASLLVGNRPGQWPARLPQATIFNASVFYDRDRTLSGATLGHLLEGLNWLAGQDLSVINISLTGPDNQLLAAAVSRLRERGVLMVAAVGNQGPSAPPLYPAAYTEVIGVTAADRSGKLYRWANRGEQVMFASSGVTVPVAHPDAGMVADSGTSLASPVVAAALACQRNELSEDKAVGALINAAKDLGRPGRDTEFGHGFLDF